MKKILTLFLISFISLSCKGLIYDVIVGRPDIKEDIKVLKDAKNNKTIVFFPMVHVAKEEYYKDARALIDSLRSEDFSFYYENVTVNPTLDSLETLISNRKTRSILGLNPILNNKNKSYPKYISKKNLVFQSYKVMGLTKSDTKLDIYQNQIIDSIENKYGEINLTECDLQTPLFSEYKCKSDNSKFKFEFTNVYRDRYIWEELQKVEHNKIVMIYGEMHWYFLWPKFREDGYKIIKGEV